MKQVGRRQFLHATGLFGAGAVALPNLATAKTSAAGPLSDMAAEAEAYGLLTSGCRVTASDVEGPFYKDLNLLRKDITETEVGHSLGIVVQVRRGSDCRPIAGAICDIWHTNPPGTYSGFPSEGTDGETWLRGIQVTDAHGLACFETVYPGWYPGRTTHIHMKVRPTQGTELTTQLYFTDSASNYVYSLPPYDQHGPKPVSNAQDPFFESDRVCNMRRRSDGSILAGFRLTVD